MSKLMRVVKRSGNYETVSFGKISARIDALCVEDNRYNLRALDIDPNVVTKAVCGRICDSVKTSELDEFAANQANLMASEHPDYGELSSRIIISNNHKNTPDSFSDCMSQLYHNKDVTSGCHCPLIAEKTYNIAIEYKELLDNSIDYNKDFTYDYFSFKTLEKAYLLRINNQVVERPQHMLMRVCLGIHCSGRNNVPDDIQAAIESYNLISDKYFTHATPTLFNSGRPHCQLLSCFLAGIDDSISGQYDCLKDCAEISKWAGGIGVHISNVRAKNSYIKGTDGKTNGIVPLLRNFNATALYVNQGGRRPGSIAIYMEPWHADVMSFLQLRKNTGNEEDRTRNLFTAMWNCNLFMERVLKDEDWSLMSEDDCPGLTETYGQEFNELYTSYEKAGKPYVRETVPAREVWEAIIDSQIETGLPYMLNKDEINLKSNQKNIGTIKSSNLCTEIVEYSDENEYACCVLASICLPKFISNNKFDHNKLFDIVQVIVRNLNKIIDINDYPVVKTKISNMKHRPLGIGVQGLADVFIKLRMPFDSKEAARLNKEIFETIYYASLSASINEAKLYGTYETYKGSPISQGIFQFDMWNVVPDSGLWDWDALRAQILEHGVRNSLLVALMPTASTSQLNGNCECIEPITSTIYSRGTLAGDFEIVNKYLQQDLMNLGLWSLDVKNQIIKDGGSIQGIKEIPDDIKALYKTAWELSQKVLVDMSIDRAPYVDQAQSLNLFFEKPTYSKLTSCYMHAYKRGAKNYIYYLRTQAPVDAQQFTVAPEAKKITNKKECSRDNPHCESCSA